MRFFNTAGPVDCSRHYCIPPLTRFNLNEVLQLIDQQKYFVLHAPRQSGKTSFLKALMQLLNENRKYRCLYFNAEVAQSARENVYRGIRAVLGEMSASAFDNLNDSFLEKIWQDLLNQRGEDTALNRALTLWAKQSPLPLVLLIDEIDSLVGDTLIAVLRQLRAGYDKRPDSFPQSIILCGVRDVRDYRIHSDREKTVITGGSAFNIKAASLRLGNFTEQEVEQLYELHTSETGQKFEPQALELVWQLTQGQPWLVNALGYEICFNLEKGQNRSRSITAEMVTEAKERIILRRETHIDQLVDKLSEERVRKVIDPILAGISRPDFIPTDDILYVQDLGLIRIEDHLSIANPIYQEIIPRELTFSTQRTISHTPAWYLTHDGRLELSRLLSNFQVFFREHSESWLERFNYKESGPQLLMQAFLQRIVNSGGRIEREYGLGRMRTDLLVLWPYRLSEDSQDANRIQKFVIELKIRHGSPDSTIKDGLEQTRAYMDRCGAEEGHLVIFDRDTEKSWQDKIFSREEKYQGVKIRVWGM